MHALTEKPSLLDLCLPAGTAAALLLLSGAALGEAPLPGPRAPHKHAPTPPMIEAVRQIVPPLANSSDAEIAQILEMMPPNYEWYLSDPGVQGDVGVLIVTHGFGAEGDEIFSESLDSVAAEYPTAVAYGMAMMTSAHIQESTDDLVAAGAQTVVVVPATQSSFDTGIRQYRYIVGDREDPAYMAVPRVQAPVRFIVTPPLADHPLTTEILLDNALEISEDQPNEVVILVGHGPVAPEDNAAELAMLERHADRILAASDFADVHVINLQDDAGPDVRAANVAAMRKMVEDARADDKQVLIVGFLLGTAGIQPKISQDLAGLDYRFNTRGLSESPKFAAWVMAVVEEASQ